MRKSFRKIAEENSKNSGSTSAVISEEEEDLATKVEEKSTDLDRFYERLDLEDDQVK